MGEACQKMLALRVIDTGNSYWSLKRITICSFFFFFSLVGLVFFPINTYRASDMCQDISFKKNISQVLASFLLFIILIDSSLKWTDVDRGVSIEIPFNWIQLHNKLPFVWMDVSSSSLTLGCSGVMCKVSFRQAA